MVQLCPGRRSLFMTHESWFDSAWEGGVGRRPAEILSTPLWKKVLDQDPWSFELNFAGKRSWIRNPQAYSWTLEISLSLSRDKKKAESVTSHFWFSTDQEGGTWSGPIKTGLTLHRKEELNLETWTFESKESLCSGYTFAFLVHWTHCGNNKQTSQM